METINRDEIYNGELYEKRLSENIMFDGRVFTVKTLKVELPNGHIADREVIEHRGGACILAEDDEGFIYLVKQVRVATGEVLLELPAGKLEIGEVPYECACREITEETGLVADKITELIHFYPTPGYSSEKIYVYAATGLKQEKPHRDEDEFLHIIRIPFGEALQMVIDGKITDGKTVVGILTWFAKKEKH